MLNAVVLTTNSFSILMCVTGWAVIGVYKRKTQKLFSFFLIASVIPITFMLALVWLLSENPLPLQLVEGPNSRVLFVIFMGLKITAIGSIFFWLIVPLLNDGKLVTFLAQLRVPDNFIAIVLSSLVMKEDIARKFGQAIDARKAKGLWKSNRLANAITIPRLIAPVVYGSMVSAIKRAQFWSYRKIDPVEQVRNIAQKNTLEHNHLITAFSSILLVISIGVYFYAR